MDNRNNIDRVIAVLILYKKDRCTATDKRKRKPGSKPQLPSSL